MKKHFKNGLPRPEHGKCDLKKRIDAALKTYLSSGKTIEQCGPEIFCCEAIEPRSRQRD